MRTIARTLLLLSIATLAGCDNDPTLPGPPAEIEIVSGNDQQGTVGQQLAQPLAVRVLDDQGRPVSGQLVNFVVTRGGGSVFAGSAETNREGIAQERWTLGTLADSQRVEVRAVDPETGAGLVLATFRAVATPAAGASMTAIQPARTGQPGAALTDSVAVVVRDQYGNAVPGVTVNWAVTAGGGSVSPGSSTTDAQGVARARWVLGPGVQAPQTLQASANGGLTATFTATASLGTGATLTIVSGNGQTGQVTTQLPAPLVVEVRQNGVPVQGAQVRWSTASGDFSGVTNGISVTDVQGRASATWTLGTQAGTQVAQAELVGPGLVVGFTANATAGAPARVFVIPGDAGTVGAGETVSVRVTVADNNLNRVPGAPVNVSVTHGTVTPASPVTDADGYAWLAWTLPTTLPGGDAYVARLTARTPGVSDSAQSRVIVGYGPAAAVVITPDVRTAAPDQEVEFSAFLRDAHGHTFSARGYQGCTITWSAPPPAQLMPRGGILYPQLAIRSSSSVTVTATCGSLTDTAQLVIQ